MRRSYKNIMEGKHPASERAPVAPDQVWPRTSEGSEVERKKTGEVVVRPNPRAVATSSPGLTYEPRPAPRTRTGRPRKDEREPLVDISGMQEILLVKIRDRASENGDTHLVRSKEKRERLPPDPPTPEKLVAFVEALEECGMVHESCRRARLTYEPVRRLRKELPELEALVQQAIERFRERLEMAAHKRAVEGWDEPVFGGQFKDRVVGKVKKYDSRLMELMLKRHIPEYRERFEGEIKVSGGVLVVPAPTLSREEWLRQSGGEKLPEGGVEALPGQQASRPA